MLVTPALGRLGEFVEAFFSDSRNQINAPGSALTLRGRVLFPAFVKEAVNDTFDNVGTITSSKCQSLLMLHLLPGLPSIGKKAVPKGAVLVAKIFCEGNRDIIL